MQTATKPAIDNPLDGRSLLVTGGTGSFGRAFVRRALASGARRIVVFSRDELKQAQMRTELPDPRLRFFIGDVYDRDRLELAMHGVDYVVHAAAMKRIEVCEANPWEAVRTNIIGTYNVARAAISNGVMRAVFLSTDKAPAAHTLYGSTKFSAERLWVDVNAYAAGRPTRLSATRYGNVIGSRGSVLEIFQTQAAAGQPVTITDPNMTRYWMTLNQAVDLVVLALSEMRGGEVFVPVAPSASVLTLAEAVAPNAEIVTTGMRGNERLHETLISEDEAPYTYDCGDYYVIEPASRTWEDLPPLQYPRVPAGWSYRSDTNSVQINAAQFRKMVA